MQEINAEIIKQRIISSDIFISQDLEKNFQLNMKCEAKLRTPKDEENNTVLLKMRLDINSEDEKLKIQFVANIIFGLNYKPQNYDEIVEKKLIPMAQKALLNSLDDMLVVMGYNKMEIANK